MRPLPREPRVENKYNLTFQQVQNLKVGNRELIGPPLFHRSKYVRGWINDYYIGPSYDSTEYEIIIFDEDDEQHPEKFVFSITLHNDYDYSYTFHKFFDPYSILELEYLMIQEEFLRTINELIDKGILVFP